MHTTTTTRTTATALLALLLLTGSASVASARPAPGDAGRTATTASGLNCELRRVDTQLVRCDNLTGAGVAAAAFIPELTPFLTR